MSYISEELNRRKIPDVLTFKDGIKLSDRGDWEKRRLEMIDTIADEMFGHVPPSAPFEAEKLVYSEKFLGSKIEYTALILKIKTPDGEVSFPVYQFIPRNKNNVPLLINIAFKPKEPWRYTPVEEVIDRGFGLLLFYHSDITSDDNDFENGAARAFPRDKFDCGKISIWAWAQSRVMDYAQTLPMVDKSRIAAIGHSRLGKTSLWCSANDTRFNYVFSNNAGASGDAISRMKRGETVKNIYTQFPYWFVPKYAQYIDNEDKLPFDQNFLIAANAPRKVGVGAADLDVWADPYSQYLACVTASPAYEFLGLKGFICEDKQPEIGDKWQEGDISFHLRKDGHCLSIHDWKNYMDFMDNH